MLLAWAGAWLASLVVVALAAGEAARRRERRRLRRAVAEGLAHDLRTPLAQIQLFSELLLGGAPGRNDPEQRERWLAGIGREARRLGDRVGALLLYAGPPPGGLVALRRPVDLAQMLRELAASRAADAAARGVDLGLVLEPVSADVDAQAVRQALGALLDAALAGTHSGRTLRLELEEDAGRARISLRSAVPRAQAHTPALDVARTVARLVAHAHGGTASGSVTRHHGLRYVMTLPGTTATAGSGPA